MSEMLAHPFEKMPVGYEAIAVSSTAIGPTATQIHPTSGLSMTMGMFSVETESVRFRIDGGTPEAAVGHLLTAGDYITVVGVTALRNLKFIRVTSDASVKATYFV